MFGGLEVKGKAKADEKTAAPVTSPAPASSSAFSFLSAAAPASTDDSAAASATATPVSSGFSFLQPSASADAEEATTPTAAPNADTTSSAFDFMSGAGNAKDANPTVADASVNSDTLAPTETDSTSAAVPASSFTFMAGSKGGNTTITPPTPDTAEVTAASGFSFLGATNVVSATTTETVAPPVETDLLSTASPAPSGAAGSGVVFGGAMATKPKKKRTRASKIGAGNQAAAIPPPLPPTPPKPPVATNKHDEDTRTKSLEAAQRAEAFLQEKMAQAPVDSSATSTSQEVHPPLRKVPSLDRDDEEVAAALEAAKEAQQMAAKPHRSGFGLGGLFRSGGSSGSSNNIPSATNQRTPSSSSMHSHKSTDSARAKAKPEETPAERLHREQEEVKRAMAERELQMRKGAAAIEVPEYKIETKAVVPLEIPSYGDAKPLDSSLSSPEPKSSPVVAPKLTMQSNFSFMAPSKSLQPVVKKKPVPPVGQTDTEKFVAMMRQFSDKVTASMAEIQRMRQHKSGLLEQRFQTAAKQRLAIQQKAVAESQQMAAAEAEDFELADRLTTLLESHEREEQECTSILENISRALEQLETQKNGLVKRITGHFSDIQEKLHKFKEEQDNKEEEDVTEKLQKFTTVGKQLSAENERLQSEWKNLERDAKLAEEERQQVEKSISEQAGVYEKLRDDARDKVANLEAEIEEMRRQLNEKQKMVAQLRTEAAGHEEEVLKVRVKFSRQLNRVQQKEMSLQHNQEDWEREKQAFELQKEEHEAEVSAHSDALVARDKLLETLTTEVEMADTFGDIIAKEIGFEVTSGEDSPDEELTILQSEVVKSEASLSEAKEVLQAAVNSLTALENEAKSLEARIPMLEETKKAAAAKRDFKTAGKASKQIKDATARLQECQSEMASSALERKQAAETECKRLEEELSKKRSVALDKEKDAGKVVMQKLADHMKRLLATKEAVCANAAEDSIQSVGSLVLDAQIQALQYEGQIYGDKFGGWDELVSGLGMAAKNLKDSVPPESASQGPVQNPEVPADEATPPPATSAEKKKAMAKFRELSSKIEVLNGSIEEAAAAEDFETAAELDEELNTVMAQIEALGLTDDEMATAFQDTEESEEAPADASVELDSPAEDANEPEPPVDDEPAVGDDTAVDDAVPSSESKNKTGDNDVDEEDGEGKVSDEAETNGTANGDGNFVEASDQKKGLDDTVALNGDAEVEKSPSVVSDNAGDVEEE